MCKKQFLPACCLSPESWLTACLLGWFRAGLFGWLPDSRWPCSSPCCLPACQQKAAMRSWRWIIALAAAKIVAYCWKCARRVSYLPALPLPLFRLLLDWPQLQAACGKDMRRPGHWHRVRVYHFNEAAAASQIYPIPRRCLCV